MERQLSIALRPDRLAEALYRRGARRHARPRRARGEHRVPGLRGRLPGDPGRNRDRKPRRLHARRRSALRIRAGAQCAPRPRPRSRRPDRAALSGLDARRSRPPAQHRARYLGLMPGAPLPLLGTFHETSFAVPDVRAAVEFYERLGFTQASTTDAFAHPYGVLSDGRLFIGLHGRAGRSPVLTFVRPGIAQCLPQFAAAGLELTHAHTGDEVFNQIGLADPFGNALAVLEARTYSP